MAPLFEPIPSWEQLPAGWAHEDVAAVAVAPDDRVYLLHRGEHPVIVLDRDGAFVTAWGDGEFTPQAHGITVAPDGLVYCTDRDQHTVRQFTPDGRLLMTLGTAFAPSDSGARGSDYHTIQRGAGPFNCPTNLAIAPDGDLYVADGYANCRVHRFAPDGRLLLSWGSPGTGPGEFHLVHSVAVAPDGRVFVCDRENNRIQIFTPDGEFLKEWPAQRPSHLQFDHDGWAYVSELAWPAGAITGHGQSVEAFLHARVSIFDQAGAIVTRLGHIDPQQPGGFAAPHGLAVDARGNLYVAETAATNARLGWSPENGQTLQKLARIRG